MNSSPPDSSVHGISQARILVGYLTPVRTAIIKKTRNNAEEGVEKRESSFTLGGNACPLVQPLWRTAWRFLKKQSTASIRSHNPTPGHISRVNHDLKRITHPSVHCSLIYNNQHMETTCSLTEEWIKMMWYIYTMEYYSTIKMNEIMPFAATWMTCRLAY